MNPKIVLLAGKGNTTNILYNALSKKLRIDAVIIEDSVRKKEFVKKRIKRLGIRKVAGQILFQIVIVNILKLTSQKRKKEILNQFNLDESPIKNHKFIPVKSVNEAQCINELAEINPDIVLVIGTRIISKKVLDSVDAKFINIHAGITPKYRNVHGAYWALIQNDLENCGVTVHLVDPGIDTGRIIYQSKISVSNKDNFTTYPLLQLAEGIDFLKKAVADIVEKKLVLKESSSESKIWHHPTFGQYLYHRVLNNKK